MGAINESIREYVLNDEEFLKLGDWSELDECLDFIFDEGMVTFLDKPYQDISYLKVDKYLVNLDNLYLSINSMLEDKSPKFEEFYLTPTEAIMLNATLELELLTPKDSFETEEGYHTYVKTVEDILVKLKKAYNV